MSIQINDSGFKQAEALLKDSIFKINFDRNSAHELKLYKLLEARQANPEFEMELAEFICGEANNSFPYRSSSYLTKFFKELGFDYVHDGTTRRFWVRDVLLELTIDEISKAIEKGLFNKRDFKKAAKKDNLNYSDNYNKAVSEFKTFFNDSLELDKGVDLAYLIDLNINIELLFDKKIETKDSELNSLIKEAKDRFFNPNDKQVALEKLWDAFERIKTYFNNDKRKSSEKLVELASGSLDSKLIEDEFSILTRFGNNFRIRHHETDKKEIKSTKHLNYLFFRMLSLIDLCLISIDEENN